MPACSAGQSAAADPAGWSAGTSAEPFASTYHRDGERLKRPPKGYDPDNPAIDELMWKDYVATRDLTEAEVCGPDLLDRFATACQAAAPFNAFLARAVGLAW
jgi:uncharacterized protein (DUF2461 family)